MPKRECSRGRNEAVDPVNAMFVDYTDDDREFMMAMDEYKRARRRQFPTWHEVLLVLKSLGYRKVEPEGPMPVFRDERRQH